MLNITNMVYFVLKFVIFLHQDISMISMEYFDGTSTSRLQIHGN